MNLIEKAELVATIAHNATGQKRKYTHEPYITHPRAVADIVRNTKGSTDEMVAAAWLHDVIEDTHLTELEILAWFPMKVVQYVNGLTNHISEKNRAERKAEEYIRLSNECTEVKTIKLADIIHNTSSIRKYDPDFAKVYLEEKRKLIEVLHVPNHEGNNDLYQRAYNILN